MVLSQQQQQQQESSSSSTQEIKPVKKKENNEVSATACSNCGTTTTPLWRRAPNGDTICNACGLYLKARNVLRPPSMKRNLKKQQEKEVHACTPLVSAADAPNGTCPGGGQCNGTGGSPSCEGCPAFNQHQVNRHALICANCRTTTTPLWRRDEAGNTICNACGLYYKLHAVHRPVSMKRSVIKRRKRIIVSDTGEMKEEEEDEDELDSSSSNDDDEEKVKERKRKRVVLNKRVTLVHPAVPAIEDYIIPKRTPFVEQKDVVTVQQQRMPPPPTTPPLHPRFDPLFDYRSNKNNNTTLPPIISKNPYDALAEFDEAMTKLERLRRRVPPEQSKVLSRLTHSLEDIVTQAEQILSTSL